jgi:hypothetical protein
LVTLLRRGTVATTEGGSAGTGDRNRLESAVGLDRKCRLDCTGLRTHLSSAHPEQVRGFRQLSVDEASVRGVGPVAAQANSHRARTAPAHGEGCAAGIVGVLSPIFW